MFRTSRDFKLTKSVKIKKDVQAGFKCDLCDGGPWISEIDVEIHRKDAHKREITKLLNDKDVFMCKVCHRLQESRESLVKHIKVSHLYCSPDATRINRETYICDYCSKMFFNKQLLLTHILHWHLLTTQEKRDAKVHCPKCGKHLRVKTIWFHFLYHGILNVTTCPVCLEIFETCADVIDHIKSHSKVFSCKICRYETTTDYHFKRHMVTHKKKVAKDSQQDVTKFFLPQKPYNKSGNRLNNIFKGIQLTEEVKVCVLCRELCDTEEGMRQHILGDHAPEAQVKSKKHMCVCGEEFFNSILLKQHIFRLKGKHRVCDKEPSILDSDQQDVYQVFEISEPVEVDDVVIDEISYANAPERKEVIITEIEHMETT